MKRKMKGEPFIYLGFLLFAAGLLCLRLCEAAYIFLWILAFISVIYALIKVYKR